MIRDDDEVLASARHTAAHAVIRGDPRETPYREKRVFRPAGVAVWIALIGLAVIVVAPLLWMVSASFMQPGEANNYPPPLLPSSPTLENYRSLFVRLHFAREVLNSAFLALSVTLLSLLLNSMAGYAFAKLAFRGRSTIFALLLAALVIPAQVAMLPLFLMMREMGLVNSFMAVIVPGMASVFGIFLIRQYAIAIPDELLDAARVDGASELRIYFSVILPLAAPALVTLGVFTFLATWNDFMWPLIVLTDTAKYTLPVGLAGLAGEHVQDTELMMAGSVLTVLPVLVLFVVLQRYYVEGITAGSVKG